MPLAMCVEYVCCVFSAVLWKDAIARFAMDEDCRGGQESVPCKHIIYLNGRFYDNDYDGTLA